MFFLHVLHATLHFLPGDKMLVQTLLKFHLIPCSQYCFAAKEHAKLTCVSGLDITTSRMFVYEQCRRNNQ